MQNLQAAGTFLQLILSLFWIGVYEERVVWVLKMFKVWEIFERGPPTAFELQQLWKHITSRWLGCAVWCCLLWPLCNSPPPSSPPLRSLYTLSRCVAGLDCLCVVPHHSPSPIRSPLAHQHQEVDQSAHVGGIALPGLEVEMFDSWAFFKKGWIRGGGSSGFPRGDFPYFWSKAPEKKLNPKTPPESGSSGPPSRWWRDPLVLKKKPLFEWQWRNFQSPSLLVFCLLWKTLQIELHFRVNFRVTGSFGQVYTSFRIGRSMTQLQPPCQMQLQHWVCTPRSRCLSMNLILLT